MHGGAPLKGALHSLQQQLDLLRDSKPVLPMR